MDDQKQGSNAAGIPAEVLAQILPVYGFRRRGGERAVLFAAVVTPIEDEGVNTHRTAVFTRGDGGWTEASEGGLEINGWSFAGRAAGRPEVWGVAEIDVAGPGPSLELLSSENGGAAWRLRTIDKVSRFATFVSLHVTRDGRGALTTELSADMADAEGGGLKPGFYTHTTIDGGASWSPKAGFSETTPPPPDGGALEAPDSSYNFDEPPGADRVREILDELYG